MHPASPTGYTLRVAIVTYTNAAFGFGVTYDDALIAHADDPADPRLAAAWQDRLPMTVASAVLFAPKGTAADAIAGGLAPTHLLATDGTPLTSIALGAWDWDEAARRVGRVFLERTSADALDALGVYWRGYPVLQLTAIPPAEADPPAPVEVLALLYTPAQTFATLLVLPLAGMDFWGERFQEIADGFFLLPMEREGRLRTGHQHAWSARLESADLRDDLATR
jgi:hypothetical protein